jgi:hypothetical protein
MSNMKEEVEFIFFKHQDQKSNHTTLPFGCAIGQRKHTKRTGNPDYVYLVTLWYSVHLMALGAC